MSKQAGLFALSLISMAVLSQANAAIPVDLSHANASGLQSVLAANQVNFQEISRHTDFNQVTHIREQQTYAGLPVWGADAVMHTPDAATFSIKKIPAKTSMNGIVYKGLEQDLGVKPAFIGTKEHANKALIHAVGLHADVTGVKSFNAENVKKDAIVYLDVNNKAHYAYLISFLSNNADGTPAVPTYVMDASTFAVYEKWDDLQSLKKSKGESITGGGYGGNPKLGKLVYSGQSSDFPALDMTRDPETGLCSVKNKHVEVYDDTKSSGPFSSTHSEKFDCAKVDSKYGIYWNGDLDATNGGYSPANDAMYIGTVVRNMYKEWYNQPVLAMYGMVLKLGMHVHAKDLYGKKMDNAFFLSLNNQMYFGDGVKYFYPLTSLGVGAHELSHGFTSQHSKLVYEKQSGGLNESYSDMAAQAAEYYSVGKNNWQIGPEIVIGEGALRYMDDPTKDGNSIDNVHDYTDDLNVHYTSGVFNKAFYLLGTAPGWNTRKAFDVMVKANMDYWTSKTTFAQAACGVLSAAKDYKYNTAGVVKAMRGVGLNVRMC